MSFFEELRRRNVIRVGLAYGVGAWLAIQIAETLFPVYGLSDAAIRVVVTVVAIGFLPALLFAWVFENTPEGIKLEKDVDRTQSVTHKTGRKLDRWIIVVLVLALAYFAVDKFIGLPHIGQVASSDERSPALEDWENRDVASDRKSLAVLPFTNMSGDQANEPFTLGIHDDLLTHLSRIGSLKTTSRTSVLQYRGTTKTIPQIGQELKVENILEGGIQRAGNRVRINLQLIDATTDEHIWAEIYDRELTAENLFTVQAEIAAEVVSSLKATLLPEEETALEATPTRSMAAYDLYLLGRHHQETRTADSLNLAVDYFTSAIAEDPDYVLAYSGLAESKLLLMGYGNLQGREVFPVVEETLEHAMSLDDSKAELWAAQGLYEMSKRDNPQAIESLEKAIELDIQNYHAWLWYANALLTARRYVEHLEALQVAYSLEPMSFPVNNNLAGGYSRRGDFVQSRQHYERVDLINDTNPTEYKEQIARTWYWSGNLTRAIVDCRQILAIDPANQEVMEILVDAYLNLGDIAEAKRWADEADKLHAFDPVGFSVYLAQGDFDGAIAYIDGKQELLEDQDNVGYTYLKFEAATYGDQIETAQDYLNENLGFVGGRWEINPGATWHWDSLLVADFLIKHGEDSPGGPRRGREMLEQVLSGLTNLTQNGHHHPHTYFGIATAKAMQGDRQGAFAALSTAIDRGFRAKARLELLPQWDSLRNDVEFASLSMRLDELLAADAEQLKLATLANYEPVSDRERVVVAQETLLSYAGYYTDGNSVFHVKVDDKGQLVARPPGNREFVIVPTSESKFFIELIPSITVEFITDDDGKVTHMLNAASGQVDRMKPTDPPPPAIEMNPDQLQPFVGNWSAQTVEETEDGPADTDVWAGEIYVDDEGQLWIDFDNQPRLKMVPFSETEFFLPGFIHLFRFETQDGSNTYNRIMLDRDGVELVFERQ